MPYSNETIRFVKSIVNCNAKYDHLAEQYVLELDDIDDADLEKLTRLLIINSPSKAAEATSYDNPNYDSMLAALSIHLKDTSWKAGIDNFQKRWAAGVVSYYESEMRSLIDAELLEYNQDQVWGDIVA